MKRRDLLKLGGMALAQAGAVRAAAVGADHDAHAPCHTRLTGRQTTPSASPP